MPLTFLARQWRSIDKGLQRSVAVTPASLMWTKLIVFVEQAIEFALLLFDARVDAARNALGKIR
jgi:hypothetical protein